MSDIKCNEHFHGVKIDKFKNGIWFNGLGDTKETIFELGLWGELFSFFPI